MKKNKDKKPISILRLNILFFVVFLLFSIIIFRLAYVQLVEGNIYSEMAASNRTKTIPFTAPRGLIKDAEGDVLVTNKTVWTITFQIDEDKKQDFDQISTILTDILESSGQDKQKLKKNILDDMDIGPSYHSSKYIPRVIKVDINEKTRAFIEEHKSELPGIEIIPDQMRNYLYGDFMAQVIGYMRNIPNSDLEYYQALDYKLTDRIGRYGLEKEYENVMHGKDGEYVVEVNSDYAAVAQQDFKPPVSGNNIILTVDRKYEQAIEEALAKYVEELKTRKVNPMKDVEKATAVVMNPKTGAVLAMANYPRFDPNWYNSPISQDLWDQYIMPYEANLAIRGRYPVGSTVKPLTVMEGLQEGVITKDTIVNDTGRIVYDRKANGDPLYMTNYNSHAYGKIDLYKALKKSSNVFMTTVALKMKDKIGIIQTLQKMRYYDSMFGLGQKTGIDLPEELPGRISKAYNIVQHSIGQDDTFTAMQLAQYVSTIANNGYRMQPYLVQAIEEGSVSGTTGKILYNHEPEVLNTVDIDPEYMKEVKQGMYEVTQFGGTAYYTLRGLPIKVGAKTGTAEAANKSKDDHAVFIGFAPFDDPQIAFAVIVPYGGGGGSSAGPIARAIIENYLKMYVNHTN